ncbi:tail assembly chaperone [Arthrobacter phage SWEP2]|uniref:Tail assembly chaperone n=1 Tax=Arthrobacter phage SWEP2 TaxID=2945958 RepID=A0A9E7MIX1_9CAUD|nr:tail assembly chaperone [Arthrobacter phage SWEP2]
MTARKTPAAAEALGENIPFTFQGEDWVVAPSSEWPFEAVEVFEVGQIAAFLRLVLDDEQYKRLTKGATVGKVNDFVVALQKAVGIQGN